MAVGQDLLEFTDSGKCFSCDQLPAGVHRLIAFLFASAPAFANLDDDLVACSNGANTIEINACASSLAEREASRMRGELAGATAVIRRVETFFAKEVPQPRLVRPLQLAQAAWVQYMDTQCRLAVELAMGGSVRGLAHQGCLASLNEERANRLRSLRLEYESLGY